MKRDVVARAPGLLLRHAQHHLLICLRLLRMLQKGSDQVNSLGRADSGRSY